MAAVPGSMAPCVPQCSSRQPQHFRGKSTQPPHPSPPAAAAAAAAAGPPPHQTTSSTSRSISCSTGARGTRSQSQSRQCLSVALSPTPSLPLHSTGGLPLARSERGQLGGRLPCTLSRAGMWQPRQKQKQQLQAGPSGRAKTRWSVSATTDGDHGEGHVSGAEEGLEEPLPIAPMWSPPPAFRSSERVGAEHGEGFSSFRRGRSPFQVDVDFLNDRMQTQGLQRIRFAMKPDEAFGLIYSWDNVIADTTSVWVEVWTDLAQEAGKPLPQSPLFLRRLSHVSPEHAVEKLGWAEDAQEVRQLTDRAVELYGRHLSKVRSPMDGVREWLTALSRAGVPCAVASSMDRLTLLAALDRMKIFNHFRAFVTAEDDMESIAHQFLSAAVKLDRPPAKCVVFEDDPWGITAAHNCSMKAVALIGQHPAYELKQADLAVSSLAELSVINLRRLFANRGLGLEFMEVQKQRDDSKPLRRRRIGTDTLF